MARSLWNNTFTLVPSWELVPKNFELVRQHLEQIAIIVVIPILVLNLGTLILNTNTPLGVAVILTGVIWWIANIGASYYLQVAAAKGKQLTTAQCYQKSWRYIWKIVGFTIIFSLLVLIGTLLLIIPGLIVLRRYSLTPFYIVDKNLSIQKAMALSAQQTKPVAGYVWGTLGVILVMTIAVGVISSLFVAIPGVTIVLSSLLAPSYFFIMALRYDDITSHVHLKTT